MRISLAVPKWPEESCKHGVVQRGRDPPPEMTQQRHARRAKSRISLAVPE